MSALPYNTGIYLGGEAAPNVSSPGRITVRNVTVMATAQPGLEIFGKLATGRP